MAHIWKSLKRPFFALAPLDDVTDVAFRELVADIAPPDIFFTEFTNCDALFSPGRDIHIRRLEYTPRQKPIIAQIWGAKPENYAKTAKLVQELGFDGIDINMGCPDKNIRKTGACSALIDNPTLAAEVIAATKESAGSLPVSVKTRLGVQNIETERWIGFLLEQKVDVITIHGRTVKEMSKVSAHWDEIEKAVRLRDDISPQTLIVGNGDVKSLEEGHEKAKIHRVDGIMIGRGIFEDLFVFHPTMRMKNLSIVERLSLLEKHISLFEKMWGDRKNFDILKKFLKVYISDFPSASSMRTRLVTAKTFVQLREEITNIRTQLG